MSRESKVTVPPELIERAIEAGRLPVIVRLRPFTPPPGATDSATDMDRQGLFDGVVARVTERLLEFGHSSSAELATKPLLSVPGVALQVTADELRELSCYPEVLAVHEDDVSPLLPRTHPTEDGPSRP
ncbi:hypothetical protein ABC977_04275 [Thioalkalicoccus limnaeus]|uniref:Uncharacterized protein n=1 Tax=Thioalkalicoccus limnaeus TaxID=120681 RepID=A0ABV4BAY0_9GAMM